MRLYWDALDSSYIPMHVHVWNLRILWRSVTVKGKFSTTPMDLAHRWWGRVIVCRIVMGCIDAVRIPHLIFHSHVSYWLRDALLMDVLLVITSHIGVLKDEIQW